MLVRFEGGQSSVPTGMFSEASGQAVSIRGRVNDIRLVLNPASESTSEETKSSTILLSAGLPFHPLTSDLTERGGFLEHLRWAFPFWACNHGFLPWLE